MPFPVRNRSPRLLAVGLPRLFSGMKGLSGLFGGSGMKGLSGLFGGSGMKGLSGLFGGMRSFLPKAMSMWGRIRSIWSMMGPLRTMMKSLLAR